MEELELAVTDLQFAKGATLAALQKESHKLLEKGFRPIEQNPFFDKEGNYVMVFLLEEEIEEEE